MCLYKRYQFHCEHEPLQLVYGVCGEFKRQTDGRSSAYSTYRCPFSMFTSPIINAQIPCWQCHSNYMKATGQDPWARAYSSIIIFLGEDDVILDDLLPEHQLYYDLLKISPKAKPLEIEDTATSQVVEGSDPDPSDPSEEVSDEDASSFCETGSSIVSFSNWTLSASLGSSEESSHTNRAIRKPRVSPSLSQSFIGVDTDTQVSVKPSLPSATNHDVLQHISPVASLKAIPSYRRQLLKKLKKRLRAANISHPTLRSLVTVQNVGPETTTEMAASLHQTRSHNSSIDTYHTAPCTRSAAIKFSKSKACKKKSYSTPDLITVHRLSAEHDGTTDRKRRSAMAMENTYAVEDTNPETKELAPVDMNIVNNVRADYFLDERKYS